MKAAKSDWWNVAVGSSLLTSAIGSAVSVGLNAVNTFYSIISGNGVSNNSGGTSMNNYYRYSNIIGMDQMYARLSKYPSSTNVSYGPI